MMSDNSMRNRIKGMIAPLALLGVAGCPSDPGPTADRGEAIVLPKSAAHLSSSCGGTDEDTEPNGTLFSAVQLGRGVCSSTPTTITGWLATQDDADVFALPMNSGCLLPFLSSYNPLDRSTQLPKATVVKADATTEVCFFGSCDYGVTNRSGCGGANARTAHLEEGMFGCCITGTGTFTTGIVCDSYKPSISGFLVVKGVSQGCHPDNYEIAFSISDP